MLLKQTRGGLIIATTKTAENLFDSVSLCKFVSVFSVVNLTQRKQSVTQSSQSSNSADLSHSLVQSNNSGLKLFACDNKLDVGFAPCYASAYNINVAFG